MPERHGAILTACCQRLSIRRTGQRGNSSSRSFEFALNLMRSHIPQAHFAIVISREHSFAVARESQSPDAVIHPGRTGPEAKLFPFRGDAPAFHPAIAAP